MSDFRDATFIPQQPPHDAILDYSHTLSSSAVASLQSQATAMQPMIKAKAVILPTDFHVNDFPTFAHDLGEQWHVGGVRLLTIVDMKDHKVQILSGHDLAAAGLNHDAITNQIVPQNFVPYMKKNDLQGAISNSWSAAQSIVQQGQSQRVTTSTAQPGSYGYGERVPQSQEHAPNILSLMAPFIIIAAVCVGLWMLSAKQRREQNKQLVEQFRDRVGPLYEIADQIGAASEYLSPDKHQDLAQRVATFFNRLTAFEKAQQEAEQFTKGGQIYKVRDAYLNLIRMIDLLMPEATQLKEDVNAVTGAVETYKPDKTPSLTQQAADVEAREHATADGGGYIKVPDKVYQSDNWRRPSWSYQPAYYNSYDSGGLGGLASMMLVLNEMQMLNMAARGPHYDNYLGGGFGTGGGGFFGGGGGGGSSSGWDSGGGSWGDSGGGGGWDSGGGGFDSGGGDWGGGGGDSGGGGGDW